MIKRFCVPFCLGSTGGIILMLLFQGYFANLTKFDYKYLDEYRIEDESLKEITGE